MLDDRATVRRAALGSLEVIAGARASPSPEGPAPDTNEQVKRWKRWAQQQGIVSEPLRR